MDGNEHDSTFEENGNDDELDIDNIHPDVPTRENNFKELVENSDNQLEIIR